MKTLTKEAMKKMKEGRDKSYGLVCKIGKIKITTDPYQFTIDNEGRVTYHSTIGEVLDELVEQKEKDLMIASKEKTLVSIHDSIKEARKWLNNEVKPLFK